MGLRRDRGTAAASLLRSVTGWPHLRWADRTFETPPGYVLGHSNSRSITHALSDLHSTPHGTLLTGMVFTGRIDRMADAVVLVPIEDFARLLRDDFERHITPRERGSV